MTLFEDDPEAIMYVEQGGAAALAGAPFRAPYEPGTQADRLWRRGFIRAKLDVLTPVAA